jgi:Cu-Zn family superoxide dismutase
VVKVAVSGLPEGPDGFRGLHVHANPTGAPCDPATTQPFSNVGPHWSPSGATHGSHEGDLPSLLVQADGSGSARSVTGRFAPGDLAGKAVVLHGGPDNLANIPTRYATGTPPIAGPDDTTKGAGDSGPRIACGVVVLD